MWVGVALKSALFLRNGGSGAIKGDNEHRAMEYLWSAICYDWRTHEAKCVRYACPGFNLSRAHVLQDAKEDREAGIESSHLLHPSHNICTSTIQILSQIKVHNKLSCLVHGIAGSCKLPEDGNKEIKKRKNKTTMQPGRLQKPLDEAHGTAWT